MPTLADHLRALPTTGWRRSSAAPGPGRAGPGRRLRARGAGPVAAVGRAGTGLAGPVHPRDARRGALPASVGKEPRRPPTRCSRSPRRAARTATARPGLQRLRDRALVYGPDARPARRRRGRRGHPVPGRPRPRRGRPGPGRGGAGRRPGRAAPRRAQRAAAGPCRAGPARRRPAARRDQRCRWPTTRRSAGCSSTTCWCGSPTTPSNCRARWRWCCAATPGRSAGCIRTPPDIDAPVRDGADRAGAGQALEAVRHTEALLEALAAEPAACCAPAGWACATCAGSRAPPASSEPVAALLLEVAYAAGLLGEDEPGFLPTVAYDGWQVSPLAAALAGARRPRGSRCRAAPR